MTELKEKEQTAFLPAAVVLGRPDVEPAAEEARVAVEVPVAKRLENPGVRTRLIAEWRPRSRHVGCRRITRELQVSAHGLEAVGALVRQALVINMRIRAVDHRRILA